jgi:hypothetical protein
MKCGAPLYLVSWGGGSRIDQTSFIQKIEIAGSNDGAP